MYPKDLEGNFWKPEHARAKHEAIQWEVKSELRDESEAAIIDLEATMRESMKHLPDDEFQEMFDHAAAALTPDMKRWTLETHRRWQQFRRSPQDPELVPVAAIDADVPTWEEHQATKAEAPVVEEGNWGPWPRTYGVLERNQNRGARTTTTSGPAL